MTINTTVSVRANTRQCLNWINLIAWCIAPEEQHKCMRIAEVQKLYKLNILRHSNLTANLQDFFKIGYLSSYSSSESKSSESKRALYPVPWTLANLLAVFLKPSCQLPLKVLLSWGDVGLSGCCDPDPAESLFRDCCSWHLETSTTTISKYASSKNCHWLIHMFIETL